MLTPRALSFSVAVVLALSCGRSTTDPAHDSGATDANHAADVACVDIAVTNADLACTVDSDCTLAEVGTLCTQPCLGCGPSAAVNASSAARIASQTVSLPKPAGGCGPCAGVPFTYCLHGQCATCNSSSCRGQVDAAPDAPTTALVPCTPTCSDSQVCQYPTAADLDASLTGDAAALPLCVSTPSACVSKVSCLCLVTAMCQGAAGTCGYGDGEWIVECTGK